MPLTVTVINVLAPLCSLLTARAITIRKPGAGVFFLAVVGATIAGAAVALFLGWIASELLPEIPSGRFALIAFQNFPFSLLAALVGAMWGWSKRTKVTATSEQTPDD